MEVSNEQLEKLIEDLENKTLNIVLLQCKYEALSELLIDHLANGDPEGKDIRMLKLEQLENEIFYRRFPKKSE